MPKFAAKRVDFSSPILNGTSASWIRGMHESGYDASVDEDARLVILRSKVPGRDTERVPFEQVKKYTLTAQVDKTE